MARLLSMRNALLALAVLCACVAGWLRGGDADGTLTTLLFVVSLLLGFGAYLTDNASE